MNTHGIQYYAEGRRGEDDGLWNLFTSQDCTVSASEGLNLLRALAAAEANTAREGGARPLVLPAPLRRPSATFACLGPASPSPGVFLSRRQEGTAKVGLSRGGCLREAILFEKAGAALPPRYFRAVAAFSDVPCIDAAERAQADFLSRTHAALASPVIRFDALLRDGQYRRLLARSMAAISLHVQGHVTMMLSSSDASHQPLALACGLAEILPVGDWSRGFAAFSPPVSGRHDRQVPAKLTQTLDWSVYRSESGTVLFEDPSAVNLCDLRREDEDPRLTGRARTLEQYLQAGAAAAQTLGQWLDQRHIVSLGDLQEVFWSRLDLEVSMLPERKANGPAPPLTTHDVRAWDLEQFLRFWDRAQRNGEIGRLLELIRCIQARLSECPALAGWLVQPTVLRTAAQRREIDQAVQQAVQKAYDTRADRMSGSTAAAQQRE